MHDISDGKGDGSMIDDGDASGDKGREQRSQSLWQKAFRYSLVYAIKAEKEGRKE